MTPYSYVEFARWLKSRQPDVYAAVIKRIGPPPINLGQDAASGGTGWFGQLLSSAGTIASTVFGTIQQNKILKLNIERAKQGMTPIAASELAPTVATVGVQVAPATARAAGIAGGVSLGVLALLALGAILLLRR